MTAKHYATALTLALLLLTGCAGRTPGTPLSMKMKIDPEAPAAGGHPALPLPARATPVTERPPQGLYATKPSPDTLNRLSSGTLSPDLRFRFAAVGDEAWVVRVDGAWFWQIELPPPPPPKPPEPPTTSGGPVPPPPPPPPAPKVRPPLQWTPQSTLLFLDSNGTWQEANPATALVAPLPAALQDTQAIAFSPDGRQALYYKGNQLFTALRDGSQPKLVGTNLTGYWGPDGKLMTMQSSRPGTAPPPAPSTPGPGPE